MAEVNLHPSVHKLLSRICDVKKQSWPDALALRALSSLSEDEAFVKLRSIFNTPEIRNLSGLIMLKVRGCSSPSPTKAARTSYAHSPSASTVSPTSQQPLPSHFAAGADLAFTDRSQQPGSNNGQSRASTSSASKALFPCSFSRASACSIAPVNLDQRLQAEAITRFPNLDKAGDHGEEHLVALGKLEFRKQFLILSYAGKSKLREVVAPEVITHWKDWPMEAFEEIVWKAFGKENISKEDRQERFDWDCGDPLVYHCHVSEDGSYIFKGPYINKIGRTLLHKELGDDNILLVKFVGKTIHKEHDNNYLTYSKVAREGILVGLRQYSFFVFKDGSEREKIRTPTSSPVKCYFVRLASDAAIDREDGYKLANKTIREARCLFMHADTMLSVDKYMDESGKPVFDKDGKALIHTDGTGFISEDLAIQVKEHFMSEEEPCLTQFRLFHKGAAYKGTFLVNKELPPNTLYVRPSMLKVKKDPKIFNNQTINSLEIVAISRPPKKAYLSRSIIALLSLGGVPKEFFMELLSKALEDAHGVYRKTRTAFQVTEKYDFLGATMIRLGIPLDESYLRYSLSSIMKNLENKNLMKGGIFIPETYMLMGTADPTGILERDEVCIILKDGPVSGKVLVYRHPGLHFGDIHVLKATYVEKLESYVGDAKYAIFFSSKGPRNIADEMGGGDFDGDMFWVSRNPKLLKWYKPSKPWTEVAIPTENVASEIPEELSDEALEDLLFGNFLKHRFQPSFATSEAADNWLASMDEFLTLGASDRKDHLERNISALVDNLIYTTQLWMPQRKVKVGKELKTDSFPDYMEKKDKKPDTLGFQKKKGRGYYSSNSILGSIYNKVNKYQAAELILKGVEKFPFFDAKEVPLHCFKKWGILYADYLKEMNKALKIDDEQRKKQAAIDIIKMYKELLYNADDFEECKRPEEEILDEAHAIYHLCYDYAKELKEIAKCGFAWKVAGKAPCELHARKKGERWLKIAPSVLKDLL